MTNEKQSEYFQDKIFKKMSAEKRLKLAFELTMFCLKLNKLNKNNGARKVTS